MSYRLAAAARRDLREIVAYRADVAGAAAAVRLWSGLRDLFELIGTIGAPGAIRSDFASPRYRFVPKDTYWVIWRPDDTDPNHRVIVRIVDARRDVAGLLRDLEV